MVVIAVAFTLWQRRSSLPGLAPASEKWDEATQQDFGAKVLQASVPVLVYFDAAEDCRGADGVIFILKAKYKGKLDIVHVAMSTEPGLANSYGVRDDVIFALFKGGREVKRIDAPTLIGSVVAKNGGSFSDEVYQRELEDFIAPL